MEQNLLFNKLFNIKLAFSRCEYISSIDVISIGTVKKYGQNITFSIYVLHFAILTFVNIS